MLRALSSPFLRRVVCASLVHCSLRPFTSSTRLLVPAAPARTMASATAAPNPSTTSPSTSLPSSHPTSEATIRQLNPFVTTFSRPFVRTGCEVGVRMSAIKLSNGDLVLYNPTELDDFTRTTLAELGTPKYIVAPNLVHHLFVAPYVTAYPHVKVIGPEGLQKKKEEAGTPVHFAVEMSDPKEDYNQRIGWGQDIDYIYFRDFVQKEIMLFHRPTKTVFIADMLWNLPSNEQYTNVQDKKRAPVNASHYGLQAAVDHHLSPDGWLGKALNWVADKVTDDFKAGMHKLIEQWTPATIVPEHGDVITQEADEKLRHAYAWVKWNK